MPQPVAAVPCKRFGRILLKLAISTVLILVLLSGVDWEGLPSTLKALSPQWVSIGVACTACTPVLTSLRWRQCGYAIKLEFPVLMIVRATYSAVFAGQFLPAGIGVDSARLAFLWQLGFPFSGALGSIALDRIAGVAAIMVLAVAGLPSSPALLPFAAIWIMCVLLFGLSAAVAGFLYLDRTPFLKRESSRLRQIARLASSARGALFSVHFLWALSYALLIHLMSIASIYFLAIAAGYVLNFWSLLTIVSVALFASLMPISFSGWGVREGALMFGLAALNVPAATALLISIVYGTLLLIAALPGSLAYHVELSRVKVLH
jgi:glycosyltransferase 2 family protein